jgi:hypothetical protein
MMKSVYDHIEPTPLGAKSFCKPHLELGLKRTDHVVGLFVLRSLGMVSRDVRWQRRGVVSRIVSHFFGDLFIRVELGVILLHLGISCVSQILRGTVMLDRQGNPGVHFETFFTCGSAMAGGKG